MKLELGEYGFSIVTESIQDVAYLKSLGYQSDDKDVVLKVVVRENYGICLPNGHTGKTSAEIELRWEDKDSHSQGASEDSWVVAYAEGEQRRAKPEKPGYGS